MISFIIPAYNEALHLPDTLAALNESGAAMREPFEIIVADDASTDGTATAAQQFGARVVSVKHRQIAATRNAGARDASRELLFFIDADTVVTPEAVRAAVDAMRAGAVGGGCRFKFDGQIPLYGRFIGTVSFPLYRALSLASGCFLFCTRDAFNAAGGFNEKLFAAEETAMSRALGRVGKFVVLRECVTTSGRKMRTHSAFEILGLLIRLALTGPRLVRQRKGLELWYGERRTDPSTSGIS